MARHVAGEGSSGCENQQLTHACLLSCTLPSCMPASHQRTTPASFPTCQPLPFLRTTPQSCLHGEVSWRQHSHICSWVLKPWHTGCLQLGKRASVVAQLQRDQWVGRAVGGSEAGGGGAARQAGIGRQGGERALVGRRLNSWGRDELHSLGPALPLLLLPLLRQRCSDGSLAGWRRAALGTRGCRSGCNRRGGGVGGEAFQRHRVGHNGGERGGGLQGGEVEQLIGKLTRRV